MPSFNIRDLTTYDEMWAVHPLQQEIWGYEEPNMGLYPALLWSVSKNGGVVLGAFDAQTDSLIAFLFSYIARGADGYIKLYSQIMGVKQEWRHSGVGEALKRTQADRARAMGLALINWTFDPLEAPNARLNVGKLRAICRHYMCDIYGNRMGQLNAGLPTDRMLVEWWIQGKWLDQPHRIDPPIPDDLKLFASRPAAGHRAIAAVRESLSGPLIALEIAPDLQHVKAAKVDLALDWRMKTRAAFEALFADGYAVTDFISYQGEAGRENYYILEKLTPDLVALIGLRP